MTIEQTAKRDAAAGKKPCARDRIFETARDLFYRKGIRGVGVESIAAAAGTTKMSLYRNFPSKDHLVAACLLDQDREFWVWWDGVIEPFAGDPRRQITALFDAFECRTCEDAGSRGCALANAAVELSDDEHPGREIVLEHHRGIRRRLRALCREMNARDPDALGDSLMMLMGGAYMTRLIFPTTDPVRSVSEAAHILIAASLDPEPRGKSS
ncbi:MAG TPA: TetR/AcrR family transcriptional regulator [Woeseiaceae bacterium]|jgi:AcrR family transcriptional regulator|nr:TetR/AcrR family transcriptional regulator [Woeseiaceae bacterium]